MIVQEGDALAIGEELERRLKAGVTSAHHYHILICKERAVAGGAVGEPLVLVGIGAGDLKFFAAHASGNQDAARFKFLRASAHYKMVAATFHALYLHSLFHFKHFALRGKHMSFKALCKIRAADGGRADPVLNIRRDHRLSAKLFDDKDALEALTCGIDRRRGAGGSAADDDEIVHDFSIPYLLFVLRRKAGMDDQSSPSSTPSSVSLTSPSFFFSGTVLTMGSSFSPVFISTVWYEFFFF